MIFGAIMRTIKKEQQFLIKFNKMENRNSKLIILAEYAIQSGAQQTQANDGQR